MQRQAVSCSSDIIDLILLLGLGCFNFFHSGIYPHIYKFYYGMNTNISFSLQIHLQKEMDI